MMDNKRYVQGLIMGGSSFVIWGLLPLYWKWVNAISPYQIFAQRVVWSFVFVFSILYFFKKTQGFKQAVTSLEHWKGILAPAFFISINWLLYIWAVNNGYVIESSLGYYINPLVLTVFGGVFFKERLTKLQKVGIVFAIIGVVTQTILYGRIPVLALALAVCFASYGLLKKKSKLDSLTGLAFETMIIGIPSLIYLIFIEGTGKGITGNLPATFWLMIVLSGAVTAIPLLLYAEGTKRLPLTVVGFLQYISPTIALVLGIFVFKESFNTARLISFGFIWVGLAFFTYSQVIILKTPK